MQEVIAIIGYNNTRVNEVARLRQLGLELLGAKTLLCKHPIEDQDRQVADFTLDVDLTRPTAGCRTVRQACHSQGLKIVAVAPFSDRGICLGALLARAEGLPGCAPERIRCGLDKLRFREAESKHPERPTWYTVPAYRKVRSPAALRGFLADYPTAFAKPRCEGNSRGVHRLASAADTKQAFEVVRPYLKDGVLIEEELRGREFSYDRVGGFAWVTEKQTTPGRYRAEIQHIVPAPLSATTYALLCQAGEFAAGVGGAHPHSAVHNELMLLNPPVRSGDAPANTSGGRVGTVEPNYRPAGMRIWDLSEAAFPGWRPWAEWLLWAAGVPVKRQQFQATTFAGVRKLAPPADGCFAGVSEDVLRHIRHDHPEIWDIRITKPVGAAVSRQVVDNAGFLGYVLARHPNYDALTHVLHSACARLTAAAVVKPPARSIERSPLAVACRHW